jgi:signal transduction histidine kinase/ligand-binding sensor domain-containing protein
MTAFEKGQRFEEDVRVCMKRKSLLLLALFVASLSCDAQDFQRYGFLNGLQSENIYHVSQDDKSNLWVSTLGGGITKYDGKNFTTFSVRAGVSATFVLRIFSVGEYTYAFTQLGIDKVSQSKVISMGDTALSASQNNKSIYFIDRTQQLKKIENQKVMKMAPAPKSLLTALVVGDDVYCLSVNLELYKISETTATLLHDFKIENSYTVGEDIIFFGETPSHTERKLIKAKKEAIESFVDRKSIAQIHTDRSGRQWTISQRQLFLIEEGIKRRIGREEGFTDQTVHYIFEDREGIMWFATGDGLFKYSPNPVRLIHVEEAGAFSDFTKIGSDVVAVSDNGKILKIENGKATPYAPFGQAALAHAFSTIEYDSSRNCFWYGTETEGLVKHTPKGRTYYNNENGFPFRTIRHLVIDGNNKVYIGTESGVFKINDDETVTRLFFRAGMSSTIWGLRIDSKGRLIILHRSGVYESVKDQEAKMISDPNLPFPIRVGVFTNAADDNFWIGTAGFGLANYNRTKGIVKTITTDDGLSSDASSNLLNVGNHVYMGSNRGVDRIILDSAGAILSIIPLTREPYATSLSSFFYDAQTNKLYFGGSDKLGVIETAPRFAPVAPAANIHALKITVNGVDQDHYISPDSTYVFEPGTENIAFTFSSVQLGNPGSVRYRYRLLGRDNSWNEITTSTTKQYSNPSPGKYSFEVEAFNEWGVKSTTPAKFTFIIKKSLLAEWWFLSIVVASGMLFLIAVYVPLNRMHLKRRMQKFMTQEQEKQEALVRVRKEISRDFHDNIGNRLAGIKVYTDLITMKVGERNLEIVPLLEHIRSNAQILFDGTRDFIWSIDPESDNLIEVYTYVKDFGEEYFKHSNISFHTNLAAPEELIKIPPGWSRQLVYIFKESMSNTLKHANATLVRFELHTKPGGFQFIYSDNGVGIQAAPKKGKGLMNIRERVKRIGATIEMEYGERPGIVFSVTGKI